MPHVALVPLSGVRIREEELAALGMSLPGAAPRAKAIGQLPALGLLTLAGMSPPNWTCSYHPAAAIGDELIDTIVNRRPDLVAVSALTASVNEAYRLSQALRLRRIPVVIGGLHATACPQEARAYCDAVVVGEGEAVWPQVVADVESGDLKSVYRASGSAPWPLPRFDLLGSSPARFTLQTQRGLSAGVSVLRGQPFAGAGSERSRLRTFAGNLTSSPKSTPIRSWNWPTTTRSRATAMPTSSSTH